MIFRAAPAPPRPAVAAAARPERTDSTRRGRPSVRTGRPVLLISTDVYGAPGGIATFMRRLVEILSSWSSETSRGFACLVLSAAPGPDPGYHAARGKIGFCSKAVWLALRYRPSPAVVGHVGLAPVAWALRAAGLLGDYVVVLHGIEAWERLGSLKRMALRGARRLVATTGYTARRFAESNGLSLSRIEVIPLGLGENDVVEVPAETGGPLEVLSVGRLAATERYKGVDTLIEAVSVLRRSGVPVNLTVVGDGDDRPRLESLAEACGVSDSVRFAGAVGCAELHRLLRGCDVFAMPSKGEGFGIVFLEAMRYGKPCIGGNHGGTPEVIDHGVNGYLVNHGDLATLFEQLRTFYARPDLRETMGRNARAKVAATYLFTHMNAGWVKLLTRLTAAA